jgi:multicomponent Na+:H+ antiporter subunit C
MIEVFAVSVGVLGAASFFLITSKNVFRALLGFILLGQVVNLFLFTRGQLIEAKPALIPDQESTISAVSDPLIQALILTAIVISFAMVSFAAALFLKNQKPSGELN